MGITEISTAAKYTGLLFTVSDACSKRNSPVANVG